MRSVTPFLLTLTVLISLSACFDSTVPTDQAHQRLVRPQASGDIISFVNTDKARYNPGDPVTIYVDLKNTTAATFAGSVSLYFRALGGPAGTDQSQPVSTLNSNEARSISFTWTPPSTDYRGYLIEVWVRRSDGSIVENTSVGVDVSSDWKKFPRYGFVSDFSSTLDSYNTMWRLKNRHINAVQFYDWQWQHHRPYNANASWLEIANRTVSRATVNSLISAAHDYRMSAFNYNLIGGGYDNYWSDGSGVQVAWGLFKNSNPTTPADQDFHPLPTSWATQKLYQFNPANINWQSHLFAQENQVFQNFAFDGWHVDSLGNRGALWDWNKQSVDLQSTFSGFINNAKSNLNKRIVFNTVGTYGQDSVASTSNVDVVYSELWDDANTDDYADFNTVADGIRARTTKSIVFPAYMNKAYCEATPDGSTRQFRTPSVLLTEASIFASGATHLELGDGDGMLCNEYFPNRKLAMSSELTSAIFDYYNFLVAYENLLLDGANTSSARTDLTGVTTSATGDAGTVWKLRKSRSGYDILHLINLSSNSSSKWRDTNATYPYPTTFANLPTKLYYSGTLAPVKKLWFASPDYDHGKGYELTYSMGSDGAGNYVSFTTPTLKYWTMVWLER